jgi:hypothetical protein
MGCAQGGVRIATAQYLLLLRAHQRGYTFLSSTTTFIPDSTMVRENSFSDGDSGRSLTPDLDEAEQVALATPGPTSPTRSAGRSMPTSSLTGKARFRAVAKKVMAMHRTSHILKATGGAGAEPGIDPRRSTAREQYGHIRQHCVIEVTDYNSVKHSFGRMSNEQFIHMLMDEKASAREPWAKVRWINIAGVSWDVVSALALKYGTPDCLWG